MADVRAKLIDIREFSTQRFKGQSVGAIARRGSHRIEITGLGSRDNISRRIGRPVRDKAAFFDLPVGLSLLPSLLALLSAAIEIKSRGERFAVRFIDYLVREYALIRMRN